MSMPAEGGEPAPLTELDESAGEVTHRWPSHLPGGKAILFTVHTGGVGFDDARIELLDLESNERKVLQRGGSYARYAPTGHVVFIRESTLYAMPFDLDRMEVTGPPFPVLEGVTSNPAHGSAQFDFSRTGTLVYSSGSTVSRLATLVGLDRNGVGKPLSPDVVEYYAPRYSPDGGRLAVTVGNFDASDIWVLDLRRETRTRLTFSDKAEWRPIWSPDGTWVAFTSGRQGMPNIYRKPSDGSSEAERLTESTNLQVPSAWSADGRRILFSELNNETGWDVKWLDLETGEVQPLIDSKFHQTEAVFSPDGRWFAYSSNESGRPEIYVSPFPGPGGKWQISATGGNWPCWSRDGSTIYYRSTDDTMTAVSVQYGDGGFTAGNPERLFDASGYIADFFGSYDLAPDAKQFVMLQASGTEEGAPNRSQVDFVLNWFEQIERLASSSTN
jgi:serine/threonine-protein kinase